MMARRRALGGSGARARRAQEDVLSPGADQRQRRPSPTCSRAPARRCRRAPPPRSPGCCATCCAIPTSAHASCRSSPTKRARSVSTRCSASTRSTRRSGRRYEPVDAELLLSYREASNGRILEEGITEAGSMASLTAAGTVVRDVGPADDPVLHLLFDVRLPAGRRPHLVASATSAAAASCSAPPPVAPRSRARACSTATARASCSRRRTRTAAAYDPAFAYEMARHRPRRHRAHVRRRARGLLLLHHPLQRELPDAGDARGRRGRHRARSVPLPARRRSRATDPARSAQILASGTAMLAALDAQKMLADEYGVARRRVERDELQDAARGGARPPSGGTVCTPPTRARTPYVTELLGDSEGPVVAVTDFMKAVPDQIGRFVPEAVRPRSAPTATASPTRGPRCGATSRWTRRSIVIAVLQGLARDRGDQGRGRGRGHRALRHRPRQGRPAPHLT